MPVKEPRTAMEERLDSSSPWRDPQAMQGLLERMWQRCTRPWNIMEVCGGQTWTLSRYRLEELLPPGLTMVHGPGCPVCVTPAAAIDRAVEIALRPDVVFCSFGDMLRVPGTTPDVSLLKARSHGADVRLLYSPLEALDIARQMPDKQVVFFAIGFETTMPIYALMARKTVTAGVKNLFLLTSFFTVPAAVEALKADDECRIDALLAAGHVCAVTGLQSYHELADRLKIPIVVTGFEPVDMLSGILSAVDMLERGEVGLENTYARVVPEAGLQKGIQMVNEVFEPCDGLWRGLGILPGSSMRLREEYQTLDAALHFGLQLVENDLDSPCRAYMIMKGLCRPEDCPAFGAGCTPQHPLGAPMVSAEGVCAAYYRYNR